jgi:hypothetical protein
MKIGVQVSQVVARGHDLQQQWLEQLEHFRLKQLQRDARAGQGS